jgi:flagellin-like hook-associated protein FlgL
LFRGNTEATFFRASEGLVVRENVSADELFGVLSDGIRGLDATGAPVDLNPALTGATRVADLRRGEGITLGEIVVSGVASATIDLRPARTVADLVEIINQFTATTGVSASTTATGLVLTNTAGPALSVADVPGGRTAAELGIDTGGAAVPSPLVGADLDPALTERTTLASLFLGAGLDPSGLTLEQVFDGVTVTDSFTLAGLNTVGDLVRRINESTAMGRARINPERTGIDVFNRLSGGRMRILENGGATAAALGILYTVERAKLDDLNGGFGIGTVPGPDLRITRKDGVVLNFDLDGRQTVREVVALIDADPGLTAAINPSGGITITDVTGGAGTLTIEDINGSFAAANLGIAGSTGGTFISGTTISFAGVQVEGIFTALIRLRDGLLANDVDAIANARKVLEKAQQNLMEGRAEAGARAAALEFARNRVEQQTEDLKRFISMDRDVDLAEAASLLATKQTILQAALLVASRLLQTSLLNFL